jgi:hypothetical protein
LRAHRTGDSIRAMRAIIRTRSWTGLSSDRAAWP